MISGASTLGYSSIQECCNSLNLVLHVFHLSICLCFPSAHCYSYPRNCRVKDDSRRSNCWQSSINKPYRFPGVFAYFYNLIAILASLLAFSTFHVMFKEVKTLACLLKEIAAAVSERSTWRLFLLSQPPCYPGVFTCFLNLLNIDETAEDL
jgi:hypothetical protein